MTNLFKWILATLLYFSLGCASLSSPTREGRTPDSFTKGEAPIALSPPSGENVVDPTYMRTQADYHFAMGDAYSMDGEVARAIEEFKLALIYDTNSATLRLRLSAEYVRKGQLAEALEQTHLAIQLDPNRVDARLLRAGLFSAIKTYDKAIDEYQTVLKLDPENTEAPVFLGALLAEQHRLDEAVALFEKLAKQPANKSPHLAYYYIGRLYHDLDEPVAKQKAEKSYKQSLELKPDFAESAVALGELMLADNRRTEAFTFFRSFQDRFGPHPLLAEHLGRMYLEAEDYDNANRQFEIQEAADPDNLNVKVKIALVLIERHRYQEAALKLEEILTRAPNSDKIRFYLGAVYEELKQYSQAINQFIQIPSESGFYSEAVIHAAYLYKLENRYPQAIATIRKGIALKPDVPQFYALYASFLDDQREHRQAIGTMEEAVEKFPDNAQLHFYLGSLYERIQRTDGIIEQMKKVLQLDDQHIQALNYLAYTYAENNRELVEAERLSRKALELQPNDGYILDTLGWILFKQGRNAEAVQILEVAHQRQPRESVIAEHLGDAYFKSELPSKARAMYQKAVENETDANNIKKLRSKMGALDKQQDPMALLKNQGQPHRQPSATE